MNRLETIMNTGRRILSGLGQKTGFFRRRKNAFESKIAPLALAHRLAAISDLLDEESLGVEPDFLEVGRKLQQTHEDSSTLVQYALDMVALVNGNGHEGILSQIDGVVHDALQELQSCKDRVSHDLGSFARGADLMTDLYALCHGIEKMVLELQMVGMNISVESVRSNEGQELFGIVATDVRELSKKIETIVETIQASALAARELQQQAHREISRDMGHLTTVSTEAEQAVQEAVTDTRKLMALAADAMHQAGEHSREISNRIGTVVEGVLFHDNMHQRIHHITDALRETAATARTMDESLRPIPGDTAQIRTVLSLQIAQLNQVILEVSGARSKTLSAFSEIARHVEDLARDLSTFNTGSAPRQDSPAQPALLSNEIDARKLFEELHAAVEHLNLLLGQGRRLRDRMGETFGQASASANHLAAASTQVRGINFEIHLLALNAIIKAAHMGSEGRALEVLAHAVKSLSEQSNGFVSQIADLLDHIARSAESSRLSDMGAVPFEEAGTAREGADIMIFHDRVDKISMEITTRADTMIQAITATRESLAFLSGLEERLARHLDELTAIHMQLTSSSQEDGPGRHTEHLKIRYTMDQERAVHEQALSGGSMRPTPESVPSAGTEMDSTLFDAPHPEKTPPPDVPDPELGNNVELF